MNELLSISWQALSKPVPLSLLVVVLMQLLGKELIDLLVGLLPEKRAEQLRSLVVNITTLGLCYLLAVLHISTQFSAGDAFVVSLQAAALATGLYQGGKSVAKVVGRGGST